MFTSSLVEMFFPGSERSVRKPVQYSVGNPPPQDSGLQRLTLPFLTIATILTFIYGAVYVIFQYYTDTTAILRDWIPPPAAEFCARHQLRHADDERSCSRPDLFSFQITSGLTFLAMGGYGIYCWHVRKIHRWGVPQTPEGRCCSYIPEAEFLSVLCFTYQVWDLVISLLLIPEHRAPVMMAHHCVAAAVGFSGLYSQYMLWYGFYFFGLSEVSSIVLIALGMAKYFPPEKGTLFAVFISACGPIFAAAFLFYRGYMWWYITYMQFKDSYALIESGQAEKLRPGKTWVLYFLMAFNIPMGILQIYWSSLIMVELVKFLTGVDHSTVPRH